jgi:hypothetical protein
VKPPLEFVVTQPLAIEDKQLPHPPEPLIAHVCVPFAGGVPSVFPVIVLAPTPVTAPLNVNDVVALKVVPLTVPVKAPVKVPPFPVVPLTVPLTVPPLTLPVTVPLNVTDAIGRRCPLRTTD